jgi:hypothetical protein
MGLSIKNIIGILCGTAVVSLIIVLAVILRTASNKHGTMLPQHALITAEQTPEVQALYQLQEGRFANCIEKKVLRPCDSQWVTCIENAWVVEFHVGETCGVKHDGRLNIHILVDSVDGKVISRFPEAPYFQNPQYCHEPYDCFCSDADCVNFIYGQITPGEFVPCADCLCQQNICLKQKK